MHRPLIAFIAAALLTTGCTIGAAPATITPHTAPEPMTALAPLPPPSTTTTEPLDTEPPSIETTIQTGDVVEQYRGELIVTTEADAEVTINGEPADLDSDGSVTLPITSAPGENTIVLTASDPEGNTTEKTIEYSFEPQEGWIEAIGDSIMLGARDEIEKRLGTNIVDATVSRQFQVAPGLVADLARRESPPEVLIIGLGTNGPVQARHLDQVMDTVEPETVVAYVNVRVPRTWEATSNSEIEAGVEKYDNAILVDWFAVADDRNELFAGDGFHISQAGRIVLADLIAETIIPGWESADA